MALLALAAASEPVVLAAELATTPETAVEDAAAT
jgi:hypothetical protein